MTTAAHSIRAIRPDEFNRSLCQHSLGSPPCPNRAKWCETVRWKQGDTFYGPAFYYYCNAHKPAWAEGGAS